LKFDIVKRGRQTVEICGLNFKSFDFIDWKIIGLEVRRNLLFLEIALT